MNSASAFGQSLRYFRTSLKISQERLSQESGLDRSYISLLERGLRQPSLTTILQVSKALNISSVELIQKVEEVLSENNKN
ncbi:MAG: helix-turn-helix transcriptional regulator [Desulfobacterium sp.]|nr:helix-turn-helix transcriptional regulator [Desulfobacterium sp.]MBU3950019.1 helix-turn-helix domain-containing protein [Pseudomonadota bacterium]MBU4010033.1 helix-turn-helix domain-containing protein [Pseudomonadota bacterium]MBU4036669.1 helix-turn-helix domain-containing protein [Pseudomonadota bacterium]